MQQKDVLATYEVTKSMKETARKLKLSQQTVRRVLISNGIYPSERTREVARLCLMGMTVPEIAEYLGISTKTVQANLPYSKGGYATSQKTINAERIADCRIRKKLGLPPAKREQAPHSKYTDNPINNARLSKGMTQRKLAAIIGCSPGTVSCWEREVQSPSPQNLEKLRDALGIEGKEDSNAQN